MFASALTGSLKVIFTALERTGYHREAVFRALQRLPRILENHGAYVSLGHEDPDLHRRAARLYAEVCLTLDYILKWFIKNPVSRCRPVHSLCARAPTHSC